MRRQVRLAAGAAGRLDRALADALGVGRAAVKAAFQAGRVRAGGRRARGSDPAEPGLEVVVELEEAPGPPAPEP
ncbi:MAG TPA: RluA family pseudouridine synthase, partial [Anaeromyxobacteraceae bacterium]|nr:RluA family pseudouridine synthase [Anaeromyxobacteraceae bacterium]